MALELRATDKLGSSKSIERRTNAWLVWVFSLDLYNKKNIEY